MAAPDVVVFIGADASQAMGAIDQFQGGSAASFALIGQQIDRAIGQFSQLGNGISGSFGDAVDSFGDFDQAMANVRSIAQGTTGDFEDMEAQARVIASTLPTSSTAVAEGFFQLASAGLDANEIMGVTPSIMNLAVAASTDFETAANGVTAAMFTYGKSIGDVNGITEIFQNTNVNFKTTMPELADSMKFAGAQASVMGVSMEETAAAIGLARNAGLDASQAGTALRTVLSALASPTDVAAAAMDTYGFAVQQSEDGSLDLEATFENLNVAIEDIKDPLEKAAFLEEVFDKRGVALANTLATNATGFADLAISLTEEGSVADAVAIQNEGLKNQMDIVNGSIEDQQALLGEKLAPAALLARDAQLDLLQAVNSLPGPLVEYGGGVVLVAAEMGKMVFPIIQAVLQTWLLFAAISAQTGVQVGQTIATGAQSAATWLYTAAQTAANIAAALFPAFLIIAGIVALIAVIVLVVKNWDKVTETMMTVWDWMKKVGEAVLDFISEAASFVNLPLLIIENWELMVDFMNSAWELLKSGLQSVSDFFVSAWDTIVSFVTDAIGNITGILTGAFSSVLDFATGLVGSVVDGITGAMTGLVSFVGGIPGMLLDTFSGMISDAATWGADLIGNFVSGMIDNIPLVGGAASSVLDTIGGWISFDDAANDRMAEQWGKDLGGFFASGLAQATGEISLAGSSALAGVSGATSPLARGGGDGITIGPGAIVVEGSATVEDGERVALGLRDELIRQGSFSGR